MNKLKTILLTILMINSVYAVKFKIEAPTSITPYVDHIKPEEDKKTIKYEITITNEKDREIHVEPFIASGYKKFDQQRFLVLKKGDIEFERKDGYKIPARSSIKASFVIDFNKIKKMAALKLCLIEVGKGESSQQGCANYYISSIDPKEFKVEALSEISYKKGKLKLNSLVVNRGDTYLSRIKVSLNILDSEGHKIYNTEFKSDRPNVFKHDAINFRKVASLPLPNGEYNLVYVVKSSGVDTLTTHSEKFVVKDRKVITEMSLTKAMKKSKITKLK